MPERKTRESNLALLFFHVTILLKVRNVMNIPHDLFDFWHGQMRCLVIPPYHREDRTTYTNSLTARWGL